MTDRDRSDGGDQAGDFGDAVETGGLSPEEAFGIVGNETRLAILRTLWDAAEEPVSFAELRRRTPAESSNFDYHLRKLVGHFVRQTGDGYELRIAGEAVVRAVLAGVITADPSFDPTVVDAGCPTCGAPVEIRYRDELLLVRCTECEGSAGGDYPEGTYIGYPFPPAGLEGRRPKEVLRAARTFYDAKADPMVDGVCPECAGRVETTIDICDDHAASDGALCDECDTRYQCWAEFRCDNCGYARRSAVWYRVLARPEVIATYPDSAALRDTVPFNKLAWENPPQIETVTEEITSRDPLRIQATIRLDEHVLRVTVDEDLQVLDVAN